jgi:hypothetical protein
MVNLQQFLSACTADGARESKTGEKEDDVKRKTSKNSEVDIGGIKSERMESRKARRDGNKTRPKLRAGTDENGE